MSSVTFSKSLLRAAGQPSEIVTINCGLKEKLEEFINNLSVIISPSMVIYSYNHKLNKNKRIVDREKFLHFHMLDYHISKKFHSIISKNPEILNYEKNTKKITELVDEWLIINKIIRKSFEENHPEEFKDHLDGAKMMGGINPLKTFEEIKTTRNLKTKCDPDDYKSYKEQLKKEGYNKRQISELTQMEKIENYVTGRLEEEESIENKISYINSYIDSEERKNIRKIFFEVAQKYKLFDIKNTKFDYKKIIQFLKKHRKKIIPIGIAISAISTLAGFFFYNDSNNTNDEDEIFLF